MDVLAAVAKWEISPTALTQIALGGVLLLFGRRLFWLLVGAAGFFAGVLLAETYLVAGSEILRWAVGLAVGLLAALAVVFLQRFAISLGGAVAAGYSIYWYLGLTWQPLQGWHWGLVAAGAVIGLLVAQAVFDFGLIFLSSLAGATLILENLEGAPVASRWLFLVLVVLGATVQASTLPERRGKKS